jgi:hypothetical protein
MSCDHDIDRAVVDRKGQVERTLMRLAEMRCLAEDWSVYWLRQDPGHERMLLVARRPGNQNTPTLTRPNCKIKTRPYLSQPENFLLCNHTQPQPQPSTILLGATRDSTIHHCIADRRLLLLLQPKTRPSQYPLLRRFLRHDSGFRFCLGSGSGRCHAHSELSVHVACLA